MKNVKSEDIPKKTKGDVSYKMVKGALASVPYGGGLVAEFFELVIKPLYTKRLEQWMESVAKNLDILAGKIEALKIENLKNDEKFITTILHATQVAIRNHQKEKISALRSATVFPSNS